MGGGLMQLVAYGAQDIYLTGNPQITFFKVVYRRHTNFAMEAIQQTLSGTVSADTATKNTAVISRNGDLVHKMYFEHNATTLNTTHDDNYGYRILDVVDLEIGGQLIDRHYGHWLETWAELTEPNPTGSFTANGANMETAGLTKFQKMSCAGGIDASGTAPGIIYIPLQFWFCRNPGLALPLIALQYHEVKVSVTTTTAINTGNLDLWVDYIYLDTDERRRFAQVSHEYLIEQVQYVLTSAKNTIDLNFNHPVKELVWTGNWQTSNVSGEFYTELTSGATYQLKLNGQDLFAARKRNYFTRAQVWQHHTGFGSVTKKDSIAVYSFALKPEEHQPSGTCNFSRIDNAQLVSTGTAQTLHIYAVNYNVLRIMSGMAGLAYSN